MKTESTTQELQYVVSDITFVEPHFPQYDFSYLMAQGSLGATYKAVQTSLDRKVAIKVIARRIGRAQSFADVFRDHAKASAKLSHSNLVQLYDFGEMEDMLYMVSEYVSGTTLEKAANGSPVDPKQVLQIMTEIGQGMSHAHKHDIVHGDLQPTTILVNSDIETKISDFGLAMSLRMQGNVRTAPLHPNFTAPEVFFDETHGDRLTDIYSMGAIMYYLLTAILYELDSPVASMVSTCDARFDQVIAKAMHPDRLQRYETVTEFLADLETLSQDLPPEDKVAKPAAFITPLAAAKHQTVRVVKRPESQSSSPAATGTPSMTRLSFPKAG